jgi:hypothetical protein
MKVVIDCDPGNGVPGANVDDAIALAFALRHPEIEVESIWTVFGNTSAAEGRDARGAAAAGARCARTAPPAGCGHTTVRGAEHLAVASGRPGALSRGLPAVGGSRNLRTGTAPRRGRTRCPHSPQTSSPRATA